jgi:hypothetical protein
MHDLVDAELRRPRCASRPHGTRRGVALSCAVGLGLIATAGVTACGAGQSPGSPSISTVGSASALRSASSGPATPPTLSSAAATSSSATGAGSGSVAQASTQARTGAIATTVAPRVLQTKPPVAVAQAADFGNRVSATVTSLRSITTTARQPGEIAGPGVAVTLSVRNRSGRSVDLGSAVMTAQDGAAVPAIPVGTAPSTPLPAVLPAGGTAGGVFVFTLPPNHRNPLTFAFSYTTGAPVVTFVGTAR